MSATFLTGDLVSLKSGGPTMTVERVGLKPWNDEPVVYCVWFEKGASDRSLPKRDSFHPRLLRSVSGASSTS
jgi:uncharacterized protein YodC (DUF2158 family)